MKNASIYIILSLLFLCLGVSIVEVSLNLKGKELSDSAATVWAIVFIVLVAMWVQDDSRGKDFDKPFDFGLFLYLFLPFLLPYYLIKTRGFEGVVTFFGFAAIYWLPFFSGLIAYVYFS